MNDLKLSDGTQLPATASAVTLHGSYADSWHVTQADSLFTYDDGQSTATFTDTTFPTNITTIDTLTPTQRQLATDVCAAEGVSAGPQFDDCVVDVALTQNNEFAAAAALRKDVAIDPTAQRVDGDGTMNVDFEQDNLPTNVTPVQITTDPATGAFAGPFSGTSTYRFYTQSLPPHVDGTLSFDLVAVGDWTTGAGKRVSVQIDRAEAWAQTFGPGGAAVPQRTGVLTNGLPYTVYRVTVPFNHSTSQLEAIFSASDVDGLANQGFGIDNVHLHVNVIPPQVFPVTLPATVGDGIPGAGAGNLETIVSDDQYRFAVADGDQVYINPQACPLNVGGQLTWTLTNDTTGAVVKTGNCDDAQTDPLPAGTYRLDVTPDRNTVGVYQLDLFTVPAPQAFEVQLP